MNAEDIAKAQRTAAGISEPVARETVQVKTNIVYYCPKDKRILHNNWDAKLLYCHFCDSTYKLPKNELEIVERGK